MRAFVGTEVTKPRLIASLEAHHAADRIIRGTYWQGNGNGKGCAVGCSIHDFRPGSEADHSLYPELFGVPEILARLEDTIFEGLPQEVAREWPLRFARAIPEGSDLSRVGPAFLVRVVERRRDALGDLRATVAGLTIAADLRAQIGTAIDQIESVMGQVLDVLRDWRDTGEVDAARAAAAGSAAEAAGSAADAAGSAADAAWSAADAAWRAAAAAGSAADAAWRAADAAWRAAAAAGSAADAAWRAAAAAGRAAAAAWRAEYEWMADALIEEIERCALVAVEG